MGAIHDELQASVESDHVEIYSEAALNCIKYAGEYYKLNIPLAGEVKVGNNWCECH
jgi:DNA polymerase I-like protein with 3'-5' exonuclease and polymerase domains